MAARAFLDAKFLTILPASRLEVDVAKLNHMRTSLHEPAAGDREIIGRAQLDAQNQMTSFEMAFQLFRRVGPQPVM
jgi:hypothetical protein